MKKLLPFYALFGVVFLSGLLGPGFKPLSAVGEYEPAVTDSLEREIVILLPQLQADAAGGDEGVSASYRYLSLARGFLDLDLYDEALTWFDRLAENDDRELFAEAIFNGRLAAALGKGDSATLMELLEVSGANGAKPDPALIAAALGRVGQEQGWQSANGLYAEIEPIFGEDTPAEMLILKGRILRRQFRFAEAAYFYENLLNAMKVPGSLHASANEQQSRFRQGAADCSFLMNDRVRARTHYAHLIDRGNSEERDWGRFQVAQLDMLDNEYSKAESTFVNVAEAKPDSPIGEWASSLAKHSADMKWRADGIPGQAPSILDSFRQEQ